MIIISIFLFIIGTIFGSFFNVCIYRIPLKKSIVTPPSHCPVCNTYIKPIHNIPLLSYIFLKGKCAYCGTKISFRYFFVELITGILFVLIFFNNNFMIDFLLLKHLIFVSYAIMIFYIDLDHGIIPDVFTIPLMIIALIFSYFNIGLNIFHSLVGGFGIFTFLLLLAYSCEAIKKHSCIGGGDLKYLAAIGFFFGIIPSFFIIFISSILALLYLLISKKNLRKSFPFGPFLAVSSIIYIFFGKEIINLYIQSLLAYNYVY